MVIQQENVQTWHFRKRIMAKVIQMFKERSCATGLSWQAGSTWKITEHTADFPVFITVPRKIHLCTIVHLWKFTMYNQIYIYRLLNFKLRAPLDFSVVLSIALIVEFIKFDASLICALSLILLVTSSNECTSKWM